MVIDRRSGLSSVARLFDVSVTASLVEEPVFSVIVCCLLELVSPWEVFDTCLVLSDITRIRRWLSQYSIHRLRLIASGQCFVNLSQSLLQHRIPSSILRFEQQYMIALPVR